MDQRWPAMARSLFAPPVPEAPGELYVRVETGDAAVQRAGITVEPHSAVTLDTYFGRFPASYWQCWTRVGEVRWTARCSGTGELRLVASDAAGRTRIIGRVTLDGAAPAQVVLPASVDRFVDGGALWPELRTGAGRLHVAEAGWMVPEPATARPVAVVMPTFNRVAYCVTTLRTLAADRVARDLLDAVYLVDQGSEPVEEDTGFPEVAAELGGRLRYIRQPNLGGSGGYSRGLSEAMTEHDGRVDVVFLDDDIWLEPDVVVRLSGFARHAARPVIVGGQMLRLLHPGRLHVGAETADLRTLAAGKVVANALFDADMTAPPEPPATGPARAAGTRPPRQDIRVEAGYNGWWACLIPSEVVAHTGYPLPAFFQWDDIEYGFRAREAGHPTVTLPGAGVWHADFDWKDWDDWHRYFNIRNSLITAVLHGGFDRRRTTASLALHLVRYLVSMQYGLAATLLSAVEDFLAGPEVLADGGKGAAAEIRALRARFPETVRHPAAAVPGIEPGAAPLVPSGRPPLLRRPLLLVRLLRQWTGRVRGTASVPAGSAYWWHVSRFATVVVTDASQEGVRVRRLDPDILHELAWRGAVVLSRTYRRGPADAAGRAYRAALPRLTSPANWRRLCGSGDVRRVPAHRERARRSN